MKRRCRYDRARHCQPFLLEGLRHECSRCLVRRVHDPFRFEEVGKLKLTMLRPLARHSGNDPQWLPEQHFGVKVIFRNLEYAATNDELDAALSQVANLLSDGSGHGPQ